MKILLGIPTTGTMSKPFLDGVSTLRLPEACTLFDRSVIFGNYVPAQRELILREAIERQFDYLVMVDDDVVVPADTLEALTATAQADPNTAVVGGLYYSRDGLKPMAVQDWNSYNTSTAAIPAFTQTSSDPVSGVGFGCVLIDVAKAQTLETPYFSPQIFIERSQRRVRLCNEDYRLCERMIEAGFTVRLAAGVRCGHYERSKDQIMPLVWESDEATNLRRMIVSDAGKERLVRFDALVPAAPERHETATIDYLFSNER